VDTGEVGQDAEVDGGLVEPDMFGFVESWAEHVNESVEGALGRGLVVPWAAYLEVIVVPCRRNREEAAAEVCVEGGDPVPAENR
jgi:hypothetical protein